MAFKHILLIIIVNNYLAFGQQKQEDCIVSNQCHCFVPFEITCNQTLNDLYFQTSFQTIKVDLRLESINIQNNNLTKLPDNAFGKVSFKNYNLHHNPNLTTIGENAFLSAENRTSLTIHLHSCAIKDISVFKAISKLKYLSEIYLDNNELESIPDFAFGEQNQLKMITLSNNKIKVLGQKAFYYLHSIEYIDLSDNQIIQLGSDVLAFEDKNSSHLDHISISFKINKIANISEFAFRGLQRPAVLDISFNNITELKENSFKGLLSESTTRIIAKGNPLRCDCHLKWLFNERKRFSGPLRCDSGVYFNDLTEQHFNNCTFY